MYAKSSWTRSKKKVDVNVSASCTVGWIFEESWPAVSSVWAADWHSSEATASLRVAKALPVYFRWLHDKTRKTSRRILSSSRGDTFCGHNSAIMSLFDLRCNFVTLFSTWIRCRNSRLDTYFFCVINDSSRCGCEKRNGQRCVVICDFAANNLRECSNYPISRSDIAKRKKKMRGIGGYCDTMRKRKTRVNL